MQLNTHPISGEQVMAYLDGELDTVETQEVAAHLVVCLECVSLAEDLQSVSRGLREWHIPPPSGKWTEPLPEKQTEQRQVWRWVAAAAFVVVGGAGFWLKEGATVPQQVKPARLEQFAQLERAPALSYARESRAPEPPIVGRVPGPVSDAAVVRTAEVRLTSNQFDVARISVERMLRLRGGYLADLSSTNINGQARSFNVTMRVPAAQLDALLDDLKSLGNIDTETQHGEDVTRQSVDVSARLSNFRQTELRLAAIQRERTGKLADVLAVEEQIDRVRGQIETAEAEQKSLANRVAFATVQATVTEPYQKRLKSDRGAIWTRLANAAITGVQIVAQTGLGGLLLLLSYGPVLLLTLALFFWPGRFLWRKWLASSRGND